MNPHADHLRRLAYEDAGYEFEDVYLELVDVGAEVSGGMRYWPPRAPVERTQDATLLPTDEVVGRLRAAATKSRVAVAGDLSDSAVLGLIRSGLALAQQWDADRRAWQFAWGVLDAAVSSAYSSRGLGGGVVHGILPSMRDANRAAQELVTRTQGEQFGELYGRFGTLFRRDRDFGGQRTLPIRSVIFAAIHANEFQPTGAIPITDHLRHVHADAPTWWERVLDDEGFNHLRGSIPYFIPTPEEIADAAPGQSEAWRPLAGLLDRALFRGLDVLGISWP